MANIYENNTITSTQEEVNFRTALDATKGMVLVKTKWGIVPVSGSNDEDLKNGIAKIKEIEAKCSSPFEMMAAVQTWMAGLEEIDDVEEVESHKDLIIDYKRQVIYNKYNGEVMVELPVHLTHKSDVKAMLLALLNAKADDDENLCKCEGEE